MQRKKFSEKDHHTMHDIESLGTEKDLRENKNTHFRKISATTPHLDNYDN